MGIEYEDMRLVLEVSRQLEKREKLLVLGDAVVTFNSDQLDQLAAETGVTLKARAKPGAKLDSFALGAALGFESTQTLDINGKASLTADVSEPLPRELIGAYDCIIDAGVLFWCFEPGAALMNVYRMLKPRGIAVHITAASGHYGRGYYNIHPLLFEDFYLKNAGRFLASQLRTKFNVPDRLRSLLSILGVRDQVTRSDKPGNVYLEQSRLNRMRFGPTQKSPRESNFIPNNVVAVLAFQKQREGDPVSPLRSSPYADQR